VKASDRRFREDLKKFKLKYKKMLIEIPSKDLKIWDANPFDFDAYKTIINEKHKIAVVEIDKTIE
jgi:hypothetical protein